MKFILKLTALLTLACTFSSCYYYGPPVAYSQPAYAYPAYGYYSPIQGNIQLGFGNGGCYRNGRYRGY